jgi:hypothetical protein
MRKTSLHVYRQEYSQDRPLWLALEARRQKMASFGKCNNILLTNYCEYIIIDDEKGKA